MSVAGLRSVMVAPEIEPPLGSVTVPFNCALPKPCASAGTEEHTKTSAIANARTKSFFIPHLSDSESPISIVARAPEPCASTPLTLGPDPFLHRVLTTGDTGESTLSCIHFSQFPRNIPFVFFELPTFRSLHVYIYLTPW